ncbi:hypothetical protein AB836_00175 [Rickettsiales bacterium (ex Bugula neritina AB1)]|nr:hypothetical protein AB836_00175 [Rickettsiales bacterium (ex Bugula neritina AB1)]
MSKIFPIKKKKDIFMLRYIKNIKENNIFILKKNSSFIKEYIIIISKKIVPKSYQRNKIRRQIKEILRASNFKNKLYIILKKSVIKNSYQEIKNSLQVLL